MKITKNTTMLGLLLSFFLALSSGAQVSYFIHFPDSDIEGDTQDNTMKDKKAFELVNFDFSVFNSIDVGPVSGGGEAGNLQFEPIAFVSRVGAKHGVQMLAKLVAGEHVNDAVITARSNAGAAAGGVEIFKIELKLVFFESINLEASEGDQSILQGTLKFGAIKVTTNQFKPDGSVEPGSSMQWSVVNNDAEFEVE